MNSNEKITAEKQKVADKIRNAKEELHKIDEELNEISRQLQQGDILDLAAYEAAFQYDFELIKIAIKKEKQKILKACEILQEIGFEFNSIVINGMEIGFEGGKLSIVDPLPF